MKRSLMVISLVAVFLFSSSLVFARSSKGVGHKRLGVGVNLGEPIGLNSRFYLFNPLSLDLTVGYGFGEEGFIIQPSLLVNLTGLLSYDADHWSLVPYFGAGLKTGVDIAGANDGQGIAVARFPIGATLLLNDGTLEISAEFGPGVEFAPQTQFDPTGGISIRYYFF